MAYLQLGEVYKQTGNRQKAAQVLAHVLNLDPDNYKVLCELGELWTEDDSMLPLARQLLTKATTAEPRDYYPHYLLGNVCMASGDLVCALAALTRSIELKSDYPPALSLLGLTYRALKRYDEAIVAMRKLLETSEKTSMAYAQLCALYSRYSPNWPEFQKVAKEVLGADLAGDPYGPHECAGEAYNVFRNSVLADQLYKKALRTAPENPEVLATAAVFYLQTGGDPGKARELADKALRASPQSRRAAGLRFMLTQKSGEKAPVPEDSRYAAVTISNYRKIQQFLSLRGIPLVAMQYPTRSLAPLQAILSGVPGVFFVSNENLKLLSGRNGYSRYFVDMYAGDFGHCTEEGNSIVAANAADVILSKVLKQK